VTKGKRTAAGRGSASGDARKTTPPLEGNATGGDRWPAGLLPQGNHQCLPKTKEIKKAEWCILKKQRGRAFGSVRKNNRYVAVGGK